MGTIRERSGRYTVEIRLKGYGSQSRTFGKITEARRWMHETEAALRAGKPTAKADSLTVRDAIHAYRKMREQARPIADTSNEHYQLKMLDRMLGDVSIRACTPERLVAFATERREEDHAGPYTVNLDIGRLGSVLRYAAAALKVQMPDVVGSARPLLTHLRLIGSGNKRERRASDDELTRLTDWIRENKGERYAEAIEFAAASAMRRGEVCALTTDMIDRKTRIASIERKHPRKGKTLERVPLLSKAWAILERQKPVDGRIFPIHPQTLTSYFTEACKALSLPDLHFHDLRHEGTSRMFESGMAIEEVALVTGHKSWSNLRRYTHLRPEDLTQREAGTNPDARPHRGSRPSASPRRGKS